MNLQKGFNPGLLALLLALSGSSRGAEATKPAASNAGEIVRRVAEMDNARHEALKNYTADRFYSAGNVRLEKNARIQVLEQYASPDRKRLVIISEVGSGVILHRVLEKAIDAETE